MFLPAAWCETEGGSEGPRGGHSCGPRMTASKATQPGHLHRAEMYRRSDYVKLPRIWGLSVTAQSTCLTTAETGAEAGCYCEKNPRTGGTALKAGRFREGR